VSGQADADPALEMRFALFFDFLGSSQAAIGWPRERVYDLVGTLIAVSHAQSAQDITGAAQSDGGSKFTIVPEVTTFSDNVLVSYPTASDGDVKLLDSLWTDIVCQDAIRVLSSVAEMALRIGVLVRGGLSCGQLYHQDRVCFGEALVDAYRIESRIAVNPRVVISEKVITRLEKPDECHSVRRDGDGQWILNYYPALFPRAFPSGAEPEQASRWKAAHLQTIDRQIALSREAQDHGVREKWECFKDHFTSATLHIVVDGQ